MRIKIGAGIWLILGILICVVILVVGLFVIVFPQKNKIGDVEKQITSVDASIQQEKNRLSQLKQYEKDPMQFLRQIDALNERIPERVELADIIQLIDHVAEEAGVDFVKYTPQPPVASENFYVVTSEAVFNGRYFNMVEFFNHIENLPRMVKVVSLDVITNDDTLPFLEITIIFRTYFTTDKGVEQILGGAK